MGDCGVEQLSQSVSFTSKAAPTDFLMFRCFDVEGFLVSTAPMDFLNAAFFLALALPGGFPLAAEILK